MFYIRRYGHATLIGPFDSGDLARKYGENQFGRWNSDFYTHYVSAAPDPAVLAKLSKRRFRIALNTPGEFVYVEASGSNLTEAFTHVREVLGLPHHQRYSATLSSQLPD